MKADMDNDLKKLFPKDQLMITPEEKLTYAYDATNKSFLPDAVVLPRSTEDVAKLMKYAHDHKIVVVPRGAGSGYTGGSLPIKGGIVVSFEQMIKVLHLDKEKKYAIVEPGVITQELADYVGKFGLFYPPDPSSLKFSTLGGNLAECAGGLKGRKYGVTRNYVLGVEAVLSDGQIIKTGLLDGDGGGSYDFESLLIGSEGTLGLITKIATFDQKQNAAQVVAAITAAGVIPSVLEYIDGDTLKCVLEYVKLEGVPESEAVLLIEVDGKDEQAVNEEFEEILGICRENNSKTLQVAQTQEEKDKLWKVRRSISASLLKIAPTKVNEDICVPASQLPAMVKKIKEISEKHKVSINNFGHAGDGNLHVTFMCDVKNSEQMERVEKAVDELFENTLKLGGTLSGEHGIGVTKSKYLEWEVGKEGIELMKKIKSAFDPDNIVNPGKIFS
jgi:glycolate oxidase